MFQRTPMNGSNAIFALIVTSLFALQFSLEAAENPGASDLTAVESADCNLVHEWSTKITFVDDSHPGLTLVRNVFSQLRIGMARDVVASKMAYLGFDDSATKLRYLFVVGIGDHRPHHRAELRFRDDRLYSMRSPDSLTVPTGLDGQSEPGFQDSPPDIVETALTVYLNCEGSVSETYQLAHMGVWHIACGMDREMVRWAVHPIPVSDVVDKWVLVVRERPLVNLELHFIEFDGDAVGRIINDDDIPRPWD